MNLQMAKSRASIAIISLLFIVIMAGNFLGSKPKLVVTEEKFQREWMVAKRPQMEARIELVRATCKGLKDDEVRQVDSDGVLVDKEHGMAFCEVAKVRRSWHGCF